MATPRTAATNALALVAFLALCYAAAFVGARFTAASLGDWYASLAKPAWTPPGAVIGTVWSVLYTLMGVSAWLAWRARAPRAAWVAFGIQLALNVAWSALFFGLRSPALALVAIVALAIAIAATLALFWRASRWAGALLVPYLAWVCFASVLNASIWWLSGQPR